MKLSFSKHLNIQFFFFLLVISCSNIRDNNHTVLGKVDNNVLHVDVAILSRQEFKEEIISNGKLLAVRKAEIKSKVNGQIKKVYFKNGDAVKQDQLLAQLEQYEFTHDLEKARDFTKKTKIEFDDILIAYSGGEKLINRVPKNIIETAGIRSGYYEALREERLAEHYLNSTNIKAPFSGKIANLNKKDYESLSVNEVLCLLIDESEFEAEFYLTEFEIKRVSLGDKIRITALADANEHVGHITEINPIVSHAGLISVKAKVQSTESLLDGMNVKVYIEKAIPGQLVVPKSAIVIRQNHEVLFKYSHGVSQWVYVKILGENSNQFNIVPDTEKGSNLFENDTIIVSNNIGLNHNSDVAIRLNRNATFHQ